MTNPNSLKRNAFAPFVLVCTLVLIPLVVGCSGSDKSVSSDLTDQALGKPGALNSSIGKMESITPQTVPAISDRPLKRKKTKDVKALAKDKKKGFKRRKNDGVDWRAAMASTPDEWPDELKNQITAAGYDLNEVAEKIKKRQELAANKDKKKGPKRRKDEVGKKIKKRQVTSKDQ